jgi:hypothetical protein
MKNSSTKCYQTEFTSTLKRSLTMTKWNSFFMAGWFNVGKTTIISTVERLSWRWAFFFKYWMVKPRPYAS